MRLTHLKAFFPHIVTNQLIRFENQLTGLYMMRILALITYITLKHQRRNQSNAYHQFQANELSGVTAKRYYKNGIFEFLEKSKMNVHETQGHPESSQTSRMEFLVNE